MLVAFCHTLAGPRLIGGHSAPCLWPRLTRVTFGADNMSNVFTTRAFSRDIGRISAAVPAFDGAVRHAVYQALLGQVTPARRLTDAAKLGGHSGGIAWRLASEALATAVVGFAYIKEGQWCAKPGRPVLTAGEAEAKALALPALADAIEAAALAKADKAKASKATREAEKLKEAAELAEKQAEAKARGLTHDSEAASLLEKLGAIIAADISARNKATAEAPAIMRVVPVLAGMPGCMVALAQCLTYAAELAQTTGATAEAKATAEALESFGIARARALEEATAARQSRDHAAEQCKAAQAEAAALTAEALELAEAAAETRRTAKAKAEAKGAARASELTAEEATAEALAAAGAISKAKAKGKGAKAKAEALPA
jgi:hypothetical protein